MRKEEIDARFSAALEHAQNADYVNQQSENAAAAKTMMWIRYCPHCQNKLCKYSLQNSMFCAGCGWVWQ